MYRLTTLAALPPKTFLLVLRLVQFSLPWRIWPPSSAYARDQVVDRWPSLPQTAFAVSGTLDKYLAGHLPSLVLQPSLSTALVFFVSFVIAADAVFWPCRLQD